MKFILVLLAVSVWTEARVRNSEALYVNFTRTWTANTHTATAEASPEFAQEKNLISVHIGMEK